MAEDLPSGFDGGESSALSVVAAASGAPDTRLDDIDAYAVELSAVEAVERVHALTGSYVDGALVAPANPASGRFGGADGTWLSVVPGVEPVSPEAEAMVADLRAVPAPFDGVLIGGPSAELVDGQESLFSRIPLAVGLIAVVTFVPLHLMFGAMGWIFQDGNLSGPLGFTATGTTRPILMFRLAFGLSTDYEVFLLSRIREEYDRTGDNTASVAMGLEKTGRIVTSAAALLAIVFVAFAAATSGIRFIKLFGLGLALAVLMDATLVPAFMRLAGDANRWLPRALYERFGISEGERPGILPTPGLFPRGDS